MKEFSQGRHLLPFLNPNWWRECLEETWYRFLVDMISFFLTIPLNPVYSGFFRSLKTGAKLSNEK